MPTDNFLLNQPNIIFTIILRLSSFSSVLSNSFSLFRFSWNYLLHERMAPENCRPKPMKPFSISIDPSKKMGYLYIDRYWLRAPHHVIFQRNVYATVFFFSVESNKAISDITRICTGKKKKIHSPTNICLKEQLNIFDKYDFIRIGQKITFSLIDNLLLFSSSSFSILFYSIRQFDVASIVRYAWLISTYTVQNYSIRLSSGEKILLRLNSSEQQNARRLEQAQAMAAAAATPSTSTSGFPTASTEIWLCYMNKKITFQHFCKTLSIKKKNEWKIPTDFSNTFS